jgi:hypothetical protein
LYASYYFEGSACEDGVELSQSLTAGSAIAEITPKESVFLFGYPNVPRWSTGVHDPLLASALYLSDGINASIFIACDLALITLSMCQRVRSCVAQATEISEDHILISATHTHSGPVIGEHLCAEHDHVVPKMDPKYQHWLEDQLVDAAVRASKTAGPARIGLSIADASGVGTNRRDPNGPADLDTPVLFLQRQRDHSPLAVMLICSMHPTVLHEDSRLISGDFPGLARNYLQDQIVGRNCPILCHTGPAGNQSPRHVVRANTLEEANRLGQIVGVAVAKSLSTIKFFETTHIECRTKRIDLPIREFASVDIARQKLDDSARKLETLRRIQAPRTQIRTAECDWFGAAESLTLSRAAADGRLVQFARSCLPAEVQLIRINDWDFIGWPGEMFVEFGLRVKARFPNAFIIAYANGELQGYLVTREAAEEGGYEASNALFKSPESGDALVDATLDLLSSTFAY